MAKPTKNAISPSREEDYPQWYQQVIKAADLAESSVVRGCMVIKPWGYALWENIQRALDDRFKATGHVNAYFPLLIPMSFLEKEAKHVEGFAKECAVVTHHRLEDNGKGGLQPGGELEEPLIIRPTSETIIGASYSKWIQSYRDLPVLINQWANVMRWEMRTRLFLRTSEFLWQEGHTAHATSKEAIEETLLMLKIYQKFAEDWLAMPVITGEKTADERFPGAVNTYSIEAMMQDRKALQAGTSHFLGQNFAKASEITFLDQSGKEEFVWTTSWGVSTRLVGALIMTHSDDDGLILPPKIAPIHCVIMPIFKKDHDEAEILEYCESLKKDLSAQMFNGSPVRVTIDKRDIRGGEKNWHYIKKGVPLRIEVGPRDFANQQAVVSQRHQIQEKTTMAVSELIGKAPSMLQDIHDHLWQRALDFRKNNTLEISDLESFRSFFTPKNEDNPEIHGGFALVPWHPDAIGHQVLSDLKVTPRCIPLDQSGEAAHCIFTGKETKTKVIFAKSY
jgi:prolyl-tRNA synthetase